jgi:hypothetical protein
MPLSLIIDIEFSRALSLSLTCSPSPRYSVGVILGRYRHGKLPKAFKIIPALSNWEDIVCPDTLSPTYTHTWSDLQPLYACVARCCLPARTSGRLRRSTKPRDCLHQT